MKAPFASILTVCAMLPAAPSLRAQPNLQQTLKDTVVAAHWIYDDYTQAVAQARSNGKPLLVTFRCVP